MKPSVVLLGILLGSSAAITFSLVGLAVIYAVLGPEYPRLGAESGPLLKHLAIFGGLTALAGLSFYGQLLMRRWRRLATAGVLAALICVGGLYWPT
jgi:hypothetical protein